MKKIIFRSCFFLLLAMAIGLFLWHDLPFLSPLTPDSTTSQSGAPQPAGTPFSPAPSARDLNVLEQFDQWLADYRAARSKGPVSESLIRRGADLAQRRKPVLLSLMRSDPRQALARMVPRSDYPFLPSAVLSHAEKPLDSILPYFFAVACGGVPREERGITWQGSHLPVYTYGHRLGIGSKKHLPVHGFILENEVAMDESPVRRADPAESSIPSSLKGSPLLLDLGGKFRGIGSPREARDLEESLMAAERSPDPNVPGPVSASGTGTAASPVPDPSYLTNWTHGTKRMLYARVCFSDDPTNEIVERLDLLKIHQAVAEEFIARTSYGRLNLQTTFLTNVLRLTNPSSAYTNNFRNLMTDSRAAAGAFTNTNHFQLFTIVTTDHFDYGGMAGVSDSVAQLVKGSTDNRTASHEYGHNLGLWHANYWYSDSPMPGGADSATGTNSHVRDVGDGEIVEYGHLFSVMSAQGSSAMRSPVQPSFAAAEKTHLGWLTNSEITNLTASTPLPMRLFQLETGATNRLRGIRIDAASTEPNTILGTSWTPLGRRYWLNYRPAFTNGTVMGYLPYGVQVDWLGPTYGAALEHLQYSLFGYNYTLHEGVILLDMTPQSRPDKIDYYDYQARSNTPSYWNLDNRDKVDSVLLVGRTYSDPAGIHITPVGIGSAHGESYVDVHVRLGLFPTNRPPILTGSGLLGQTTPAVAPGQSVDLSVIASDPDGDDLAYAWSVGRPEPVPASLNQPSFSYAWNDPGEYEVSCVVSDLRGGTATHVVRVLVTADPPRFPGVTAPLRLGGTKRDAPIANGLITLANGQKVMAVYTESHLTNLPGSATNRKSDFLLMGLSPSGIPIWSNLVGSSGWDGVYDLCPLPDGGFAVSGYFQGQVGFGTNTLGSTNTNSYRGFVAAYGPDGSLRWAKTPAPESKDTWPYTVSTGPSNTVIVGGTFSETVVFPGFSTNSFTAHEEEDAFALAFSAEDGTPRNFWIRPGPDAPPGDDWISWLRPGPDATTYAVEGRLSDSVADQYDYHLLRWSSDFSPLWESVLTGPMTIWAVPHDLEGVGGDLLLVLRSEEPFRLEHGSSETPLLEFSPGTYLVRLHRATGSPVWTVPLPGLLANYIRDLFVTPEGEIFVAGNFYQSMVLAGSTLSSAGSTDLFLARLTADGVWREAWRLGSFDAEYVSGIAPGPDGAVSLAGSFWNQTAFGSTGFASSGEEDIFLLTLTPPPVAAPSLTLPLPAGPLPTGETFSLTSTVTGAQPLRLQWSREGQPISGQTNPVLTCPAPAQATNLTFSLQALNYAGTATTNVVLSFKNRQTISFPALPLAYLSGPAPLLSATSSSTLPVVYTSSHTNVARIGSGSNGPVLDLRLPGETQLTASQPGNEAFLPAESVSVPLDILPDPVSFPWTDDFSEFRPYLYGFSAGPDAMSFTNGTLGCGFGPGSGDRTSFVLTGARLPLSQNWVAEVDVVLPDGSVPDSLGGGLALVPDRPDLTYASVPDQRLNLKLSASGDTNVFRMAWFSANEEAGYFALSASNRTARLRLMHRSVDGSLQGWVDPDAAGPLPWTQVGTTSLRSAGAASNAPGRLWDLQPGEHLRLALRAGVSGTVSATTGRVALDQFAVAAGSPPSISVQPVSVGLALGGNANFSVNAAGSDPLTYQWRRNGTNLSEATNPSLGIPNVQAAETGSYSVVVSNFFGSATSTVASLVTIPLPPATLSAVLGSNTVTFSWSAVSNAVSYRLSGSNTAAASTNFPGLTGTSRVVTNLPAGTWTFRAYASNSAGESPSFSATTFNYFSAPPLDPANFTVSFPTTNTVTLSWSAVSNASSYRYWAKNQTTGLIYQATNLTTTSLTLTNLPPGSYDWYLHAVNNAGSSTPGANRKFPIATSRPSDPTNFTVSFPTTNTTLFSWSAVSNASSYRYWAKNQTTGLIYQATNLTTTSLTLTNLPPGSYDWYLHAVNNAGSSTPGANRKFTSTTARP